jgi:hypothetical protein
MLGLLSGKAEVAEHVAARRNNLCFHSTLSLILSFRPGAC